jgi:ABC-type multidrug transport system ATPase subunit
VCLNTTPSLKNYFEDNLGLYATFKGVTRNQIKKRVDNMIFDLELDLIQKQLASTHSDVQKRKTSTRIAFIYDRKVIMLDELTIGFKTTTLCKFWQMLKNKQGR